MSWIELDKRMLDIFPDAPSFDYKRFYVFAKKYGYSHYSEPPVRTNLETFLYTKKDEKMKAERGFPPHYSNAIFLSGRRRPVLLIYQPLISAEDIIDDLNGWDTDDIYDVNVYDGGQCWYDTEAKNICNVIISLKMINFRDARKTIERIVGVRGKAPKEEFSEDEIRDMLKPLRRIEGLKVEHSTTVSELIKQIYKQLDSGQVSKTPFKKIREIIDEPKNYDRNV